MPQTLKTMKDTAKHPWGRLGAWQAFELLQEKKRKRGMMNDE
jgi:hypothetical protein